MSRVAGITVLVAMQVMTAQTITTIGGNGQQGFTGDGGPALQANLDGLGALAADRDGNIYLADTPHSRVRKISPEGVITTVAGNGQINPGPRIMNIEGQAAVSVALGLVRGLATGPNGVLFICDQFAVRRVDGSGTITTIAGLGSRFAENAPASKTAVAACFGLAADDAGNLYYTDSGTVRKVDTAATVTTIAGTLGTASSNGDGGQASAATLNNPEAIAIDPDGNLYISESLGQRIRKVATDGIISTVIGGAGSGFSGDNGPASQAKYGGNSPALAVDGTGNVYLADGTRVRRISTAGIITTFAGTGERGFSGDGGRPNLAKLGSVTALAFDTAGDLYIGDQLNKRVRRVTFGAGAGAQPVVAAGGIVNAASFTKEIAPGSLVTLFGSDLAAATAVADRLPLPFTLGGASVKVGGFPAPLIYVSPTQINLQIPYETRGGTVPLVVTTAAGDSVPALAQVVAEAPGILTYGAHRAIAQNQDGVLNEQAHPAKAGSVVVVYLTGAGAVSNAPPTGAPAPSNPVARLQSKVTVTLGGLPCTVQFAGLTPDFVGLVQLNLTVPALTGDYPLVATFGATASNPAILSVQR